MNKLDTKEIRLLSITGVVVLAFVLMIINAYNYLPSETSDIPFINTGINLPDDETSAKNSNEQKDENTKIDEDSISETNEKPQEEISESDKLTPLENISEENNAPKETVKTNPFEERFNDAKRLKADKQWASALSEYQSALNLAENNQQKAECYEEISGVYALAKKYGTALSFAQKAYNLVPSTAREILLARLYYKTGAIDKATERINNVLRRDFNLDN